MMIWFFNGKPTVCELEHGPVEIVDLPIEHGDFPVCKRLPEGNIANGDWVDSIMI